MMPRNAPLSCSLLCGLIVLALPVTAQVRGTFGVGPWEGESWSVVEDDMPFVLQHRDTALEILEGATPVLAYNYGQRLADGVNPDRRRSSYIHPLYGLDGEVLTYDFPQDHFHHRGLYWTWPRVKAGDEEHFHDMWHLRGMWTRFERWLEQETTPAAAVVGIQNGWYDGMNNRVAEETVWMRVWRANDVGRVIDFDFTWRALNEPITIQGKHDHGKEWDEQPGYGGFLLRPVTGRDVVLANDGSPDVPVGNDNLVPSAWADFSSKLGEDDDYSGLAIFPSLDHPDYPPGWVTRYYGFLGVSWPGREAFVIQPDTPLRLRYRVYIHRGDWESGKVREAFQAYVEEQKSE